MSIDVPQFRRHTNRTGLGADLGKRIVHLREIVQQGPPSSRRTRTRTRTTTTTTMTTRPDPASMVPHRPSGCAAERHPVRPRPARPPPLRYVPGRRQPVGIRARARTGETREEPPRTEVGRYRPAAAPCRGPSAAPGCEEGVLCFKCLLRPSSNHSARRCRPPQDAAPSASGGGAPPRTCRGAYYSSLHEKGVLVRIRSHVCFIYLSSSVS